MSIDEFIVTNFLIGSGQTLPIYIYNQIKFGITPEVNALASVMLLATVLLLGVGFALPTLLRRLRLRRPRSGPAR